MSRFHEFLNAVARLFDGADVWCAVSQSPESGHAMLEWLLRPPS